MSADGLRWQLRAATFAAVAVCVFFVGFGIYTAWHSAHALPRTYAHLRRAGVPATAQLVVCAPGVGGGRGVGCRLRLDFAGRTRTWNYPEDSGQFERRSPGDAVRMLVDPARPDVAYTVRDVEAGTNAGWGPLAFFGAALALAGLAGLVWIARLERRLRPAKPSAPF